MACLCRRGIVPGSQALQPLHGMRTAPRQPLPRSLQRQQRPVGPLPEHCPCLPQPEPCRGRGGCHEAARPVARMLRSIPRRMRSPPPLVQHAVLCRRACIRRLRACDSTPSCIPAAMQVPVHPTHALETACRTPALHVLAHVRLSMGLTMSAASACPAATSSCAVASAAAEATRASASRACLAARKQRPFKSVASHSM